MGKLMFYFICLSAFGIKISGSIDNIIDIGHFLTPEAPVIPFKGVEPFKLEVVYRHFLPTGWYANNKFTYTTYTGTDFEAPYISYKFGWKVHEVPVDHLLGDVSVIDISQKVSQDSSYELSSEDVDDWLSKYGLFPNNSVILIRTGWDKRYFDAEAYFGVPPNLTYPSMSEGAARKILRLANKHNLNIFGIGIDSGNVDPPVNNLYVVHQLFASANKYILQNLKNLELVPPKGARIAIAPTNIRGTSGVPVRVVVVLPFSAS
ncbi:UNVERIFIED_CONTAM: hypothetical protein RMT77_008216 [Armadillidium vulgare]